MQDILKRIEASVEPGTIIPKPAATGEFVVKGWGTRRGERALIYTIPNHKNPARPYAKGITVPEWQLAYEQLLKTGEFSRAWFNEAMPACAKEGGCNFTTIGGIFQFLGVAEYQRGTYRRTP